MKGFGKYLYSANFFCQRRKSSEFYLAVASCHEVSESTLHFHGKLLDLATDKVDKNLNVLMR